MGSLEGLGIVLFILFAAAITAMYILTRRDLAPIGLVAGVGTVVNVILIMLISLAERNPPLQAVVVGVVVGVLFSGASVAIAAYFRANDVTARKAALGNVTAPALTDKKPENQG